MVGFSAAIAALFVSIAVLAPERPESFLALAAVIMTATAVVDRAWSRVGVQAVVVAGVAVALAVAGRPWPDLLLPAALLLAVGVVSDALAGELVSTSRAEAEARRSAEQRGELLAAVRQLPSSGLHEAATAANRALRSLGFDAAGLGILQPDGRLTHVLDGIPPTEKPQYRGEGLAGRAIAENRTLVVADYQAHPDRLEGRTEVRSAVLVPIRVEGQPVAVLVGARWERGQPDAFEVEVAEVLAAHLGVVLDADARLRRERELAERMSRLEAMRSSFVSQVSDELRQPLTVVRGIGQTLAAHADALVSERRKELLRRMSVHSEGLRSTIDSLLDFSRFQATRPEPALGQYCVGELLGPLPESIGAELVLGLEPDTVVEVDAELVRHALELLLGGRHPCGARLQFRFDDGRVLLEVDGHATTSSSRPGIVRSVVARLLVLAGAHPDDELRLIEFNRVEEQA